MADQPLFIPVIFGTVRKGRARENVARFYGLRTLPRLTLGRSIVGRNTAHFSLQHPASRCYCASR